MDASSSSNYRCTYHVFLSFRGEDTRTGFTDHLHRALELAGIHSFRDDDEIERGANIAAELEKAIQESRVSIVVFSEDYASSTWCLDELVNIMNRSRETGGHTVIPVFYHVDPSDVRKQTGSFAQAFARHEERFKDETGKVVNWRRALRDVPDLAGMVLRDHQYESQFIQDIVKEIENKLDRTTLNVAPYAVGIDYRVKCINRWLEDGSNDVGIAVIYGMGGIGKTTIARAAYNLHLNRFHASSFVPDIRGNSGEPMGLVHLQRKLLFDILKGKGKEVYDREEGMIQIKRAVSCKRVLIVLDDVDHLDQFNAFLGMRKSFCPGSKIIITTRHGHLLKGVEVSEMFQVPELTSYESLELFSWHAFGQANPLQGYMELSRPLVNHCAGLPLALQVMGSYLSGRSVDVWQSALQNLEVIINFDGKIKKILQISFDSLQDRDRSLFLHIACFFIGKGKDFMITVLHTCDLAITIGIENLVDRCLVKINEDNKLIMHQLLGDMGREIIRKESPEDPGKRSRLLHKDAINILTKFTGTETVKGLMLKLPMLMKDDSSKKRCRVEDYSGNCSKRGRLGFFSRQSINISSTNSAPVTDEVEFKTEAFTRMHNLEILLLNNVKLSGGFEYFPKNLLWLCWRGFPLESIPPNFYLENLVALDLRNSNLRHGWKGTKFLQKLKVLNLSHSHGLVTTPDLSGLPNLERLILKDCINLVEVDESIGNLEKLVLLNLKDCKNLVKLPTLRSIQSIILSGCLKLVLSTNTTATNQLQSTASNMKKLCLLLTKSWQSISPWAFSRKNIELSRFSLSNLPNCLRRLSLDHCNLSEISTDLSFLSSLKYLDLSDNPIVSLPENMINVIMLEDLLLKNCRNLKTIPELPPGLRNLIACSCSSMERIANLPNLFTSLNIQLYDSGKIVEVECWLRILPLSSCSLEFNRYYPGMFNWEFLESTEVEMKDFLSDKTTKGLPQALYECGITSTFVPGSRIPDQYFRHRRMGNSVMSVVVPSRFNCKIKGLNAFVRYAQNPDLDAWLGAEHYLKVSNETKGVIWNYCPVRIGVPESNGDMLWLSHWPFEDDELEAGDKLRVSVRGLGFLTKEFGIDLVYSFPSNSEDITSENAVSGLDLVSSPCYQLYTGKYFLNNHWHVPLRRTHEMPFQQSVYAFLFEHEDEDWDEYEYEVEDLDQDEDEEVDEYEVEC